MGIKDKKRIAYTLREEQGETWEKIGRELGISRHTASRYAKEYGSKKKVEVVGPEFNLDRFKPIHVYGDAAITCDWHVPLHSADMVLKLFGKAQSMGIKQLVIAGDLFNQDTFSHFSPKQSEAGFPLERAEAIYLLDLALDVFERIYISWGNHDFRIVKALNHTLSFEYCMKWILEGLGPEKLSRITFSELDYIIYHPGKYDVRLCHQTNHSKVPLAIARDLVSKYHMSVLTAHLHYFAQGVAKDGENLVFEGGGLFDPSRTEYIQRTNTHNNWTQGFYIWKDGICHPYSPAYYNL